jgi:hypothetical protein
MTLEDRVQAQRLHVFRRAEEFGSATVHVMIPEPTTAILVGAGLLGLLVAARRKRRG